MYSNLENDCIAIVTWFYKHQGQYISLRQAADEIGIHRTTLSRYINAHEIYGSDNWFLGEIGRQIGYRVIYTGRVGEYIWVEKLSESFK